MSTRHDKLPGEDLPLVYTPGRGPVTESEALGVMRRRRRVDLAYRPKRPGVKRPQVPDELPASEAPKQTSVSRFPPRILAVAYARAEIEDIPLTAILEEALIKYAEGPPESPEAVKERLAERNVRSRAPRRADDRTSARGG